MSSARRDLVWIDIETTGTDPRRHEIIEIAVKRTTWDLQVRTSFEAKVHPTRISTASPEALKVNNYSPDRWGGALTLGHALRHAHDAIVRVGDKTDEPFIFAGQNVGFDLGFVLPEFESYGLTIEHADYRKLNIDSLAWPLVMAGLIDKPKLEVICGYLGISNDGQHTAMVDVDRAIEVYRRISHHLTRLARDNAEAFRSPL